VSDMATKRGGFDPSEYVLGPDIDLDEEVVYLADGRRLTNALAEELGPQIADELRVQVQSR